MAPSIDEANNYYHGLPSPPLLVARSSTTPWNVPVWRLHANPKELRPVEHHSLLDIWENNLAIKVHNMLNARKVNWTSTDIVRIGYAKNLEAPAPVVLWISVLHGSLSGKDGDAVARECIQILQESDITDVEVEIREAPLAANDTSMAPGREEAWQYYSGLPSVPVLVARTGAPYEVPTGRWACARVRELLPIGSHALQDVWEDNLALKIIAALDARKLQWSSIDVVRIGYRDAEESVTPAVLWIGVIPASISGNDGAAVAHECRDILKENNITDVEVEIRESVVTRSAGGPKLLQPNVRYNLSSTIDARRPLSTSLGLSICAESTPQVEGTGGFFIYDGKNTKRLLLVTARHVVFHDKDKNEHFQHKDGTRPRHTVRLFGDEAFERHLKLIQDEIRGKTLMTEIYQDRIKTYAEDEDPDASAKTRVRRSQEELIEANEAIEQLTAFYDEVKAQWTAPEDRVLGHVVLSPPLSVSGGYTEDWAVIEVDESKVDGTNFTGNDLDLGTRVSVSDLTFMMRPDWRHENARSSFKYPPLRHLLTLKDTIPDAEMRSPPASTCDKSGVPCLMVMKQGSTTGLTVGRANEIFSYARVDAGDGSAATSKEWAILPQALDAKVMQSFSGKGDSGSVVVDDFGRIGGLLTGGAGSMLHSDPFLDTDISYATPISSLLDCMKKQGLDPVFAEVPSETRE